MGVFRISVWMSLTFSLNSVICQDLTAVVKHGSVGETVLLPCFYNKILPVNVFWRDKNDNRVLNIEDNLPQSPSPKYRDRVVSFPELYKDGNFSIKIADLTLEDTGTYKCVILTEDDPIRVSLNVSEKRETEAKTTARPSGGAAETTFLHVVVLSALCLLLCF